MAWQLNFFSLSLNFNQWVCYILSWTVLMWKHFFSLSRAWEAASASFLPSKQSAWSDGSSHFIPSENAAVREQQRKHSWGMEKSWVVCRRLQELKLNELLTSLRQERQSAAQTTGKLSSSVMWTQCPGEHFLWLHSRNWSALTCDWFSLSIGTLFNQHKWHSFL